MSLVVRSWQHPAGWDGGGWDGRVVRRFEQMVRAAARKVKGAPALVSAWDDGRSVLCWYEARAGEAERALRDRCRKLFGARERLPADATILTANLWKANSL